MTKAQAEPFMPIADVTDDTPVDVGGGKIVTMREALDHIPDARKMIATESDRAAARPWLHQYLNGNDLSALADAFAHHAQQARLEERDHLDGLIDDTFNEFGAQGYGRDTAGQKAVTEALTWLKDAIRKGEAA